MACPPSDKITGYGAIWQYLDVVTQVWITVAGTTDVSFASATTASIDTTSSDGPKYSTARPDPIAEWNSIDIDAHWKLSQWSAVQRMKEDNITTDWRIVVTQVSTEPYIQFCAFITDIADEYPLKDLATNTITIMPSGAPIRSELNPA